MIPELILKFLIPKVFWFAISFVLVEFSSCFLEGPQVEPAFDQQKLFVSSGVLAEEQE